MARRMYNNDILRRLRYALNLSDAQVAELFALGGGHAVTEAQARGLQAREDQEGYQACSNEQLAAFLDGLIVHNRGPRKPGAPAPAKGELTNNGILKKLRIALTLHEEDMLRLLKLGGMTMSRSELGALFRKPSHRHFRQAGDQVLRNLLNGLTKELRPA